MGNKFGKPTSSKTPERSKAEWELELEREGWTVVPGVLSRPEVDQCLTLTWDWLESLGSGIDRSDASTWTDSNWPGNFKTGITSTFGSCQQPSLWFIRGHPGVQQVFATIWSVQPKQLITSMDAILLWRHGAQQTKKQGLGLHIDQDPFRKRGFHCVQGMVPFLDVTKEIGGLQLVPKSHTEEIQEEIRQDNPNHRGNFVKVSDDKYLPGAVVVEAQAGDLILWDSRLIHGSHAGPGMLEGGGSAGGLARCTGLVCMSPRAKASKEVLDTRTVGFQSGLGFSHWPHEAHISAMGNTDGANITWEAKQYKPLELTPEQRRVL